MSAAGATAVGSGLTDEDAPATAAADLITASANGTVGPRVRIKGAQQTLAVAYLGKRPVLLTGTSPAGVACCSSAATQTVSGSALGAPEKLASGLEGASTGALVAVRGGLLAAVDNQAGITVARAGSDADFLTSEQLVGANPTPPLLAASALADGGAVVAWTGPAVAAQTVTGTTTTAGTSATTAGYDQPADQLIYFATDGPAGLPGAPRLAVEVPSGHEIDALDVVEHGAGATLAWTESWDQGSRYRSEVFWADLRAGAQASALSPPSSVAVGLSMAAGPDGHQVLAWQSCNSAAGTCTADAALRPHGDGWGPVRSLGAVDPTSFPVAAQSSLGQSLVGWIANGVVDASAAKPGADGFSRAATVATTGGDGDLTLDFSANSGARAVWVQGTVDQKLVSARFTP